MRTEIGENKIWASVDETYDVQGQCVEKCYC